MSWEFCSRRHEEYITRRVLAPQVSNLLQIAQQYQSTAAENGPTGVSNNDAQKICNMFVTASRQLAKNLEHHTLNEHGLSKRYVHCLQISEVVNHMKDLIEFTSKNNLGPIEGLNKFCKPSVPKLPVQNMQESKHVMVAAGVPNDQNTTKAMDVRQEMSVDVNGPHGVGATDNNVAHNAAALNSYQNVIRSASANQSLLRQEASSVFKGTAANVHNGIQLEASRFSHGPNQGQLAQFEHTMSFQHPMPQQNSLQGLGVHNSLQGLSTSSQYEQHVLRQLLAAAKNNNQPLQQPPPDRPNVNSSLASGAANSNNTATREQAQRIDEGTVKDACTVGTGPSNVINNSTATMVPSRSNSFKSVSSNPAAPTGGNAPASKAESFHELDDLENLDDLINNQFAESGFLWDM